MKKIRMKMTDNTVVPKKKKIKMHKHRVEI